LPESGPWAILKVQRRLRAAASVFGSNSGGTTMEWTTPQHEVVDLNCEVSSYANAEL
jgi:hypothetical protein